MIKIKKSKINKLINKFLKILNIVKLIHLRYKKEILIKLKYQNITHLLN